jgi:hypothetical protein|tara:strand:+ start:1203 stop:1868 length:666 start_codon:yes stop_codon:yes gene_type:complete
MVKILGHRKNVFWEAFLLTATIFILGLLLGVAFEKSQTNKLNEYYLNAEISLVDIMALNNFVDLEDMTCSQLISSNMLFADRIYEEALIFENFEDSWKITGNVVLLHERYDILRTLLWINVMKTREKCSEDFSSVIYLYEDSTDNLNKKAVQKVWSKILFDLKKEKGEKVILIPIGVNNDLTSLDLILSDFGVSEFPVVIINDEHVIQELNSVSELEKYLD